MFSQKFYMEIFQTCGKHYNEIAYYRSTQNSTLVKAKSI